MLLSDPLPLMHSWPLFECDQRIEHGLLLDGSPSTGDRDDVAILGAPDVGQWDVRFVERRIGLVRQRLRPCSACPAARCSIAGDALACYTEPSRAVMERLRSHAIRHRRGFTLDAHIRRSARRHAGCGLIAWPECIDGKVVRLSGLKRAIDPAQT